MTAWIIQNINRLWLQLQLQFQVWYLYWSKSTSPWRGTRYRPGKGFALRMHLEEPPARVCFLLGANSKVHCLAFELCWRSCSWPSKQSAKIYILLMAHQHHTCTCTLALWWHEADWIWETGSSKHFSWLSKTCERQINPIKIHGLLVLNEVPRAQWSTACWAIPPGQRQVIASSTDYDPKSGLCELRRQYIHTTFECVPLTHYLRDS